MRTFTMRIPILILAAAACQAADPFIPVNADRGAGLPADAFYPHGRKMIYAGYSGEPARDLAAGFTAAGPAYGISNEKQSRACEKAGIPHFVQVGPFEGNATGKWETVASLPLDEVRRRVAEAVRRHANSKLVICWAVQPEELRPYRKDEMEYLGAVCEAIRGADPKRRPIFLYNTNNRDRETLPPIAACVDIVAKGCYANAHGHKDQRAWVRWSVEQLRGAADDAGKGKMTFVMPLLAADPDPSERALIPVWVRHDIYLGLMSGAEGMLTWSLHKREEVRETWQDWYDAYARCGRELNGERGLAQVFLFGEPRTDLAVSTVEPRAPVPYIVKAAEFPNTAGRDKSVGANKGTLHLWTTYERAFGKSHYLFIANSTTEPTTFLVRGVPAKGMRAESAFDGKPVALPGGDAPLSLRLAPWEVVALKFSAK